MGLLKKFKKGIKKITKPISRFLGKVVPREVKPFLPFAAAAVPFLAPASGVFASMAGRAALSGGANLLSQLSQEGSEGDFSGLSFLASLGTGALSAPQVSKGITTSPQEFFAMRGDLASEGTGILSGAKQFGFEGLSKGAEAVGGVLSVTTVEDTVLVSAALACELSTAHKITAV